MKENGAEGFIEGRADNDGKAIVNILGKWYRPEDVEQVERQNAARRAESDRKTRDAWEATPQGKLCLVLYEAFQAYRAYLEQNPHAHKTIWGSEVDFDEHKLFEHGLRVVDEHRREVAEKLRKNLEKAQAAARCEHEYLNGNQCKAPRVKGGV